MGLLAWERLNVATRLHVTSSIYHAGMKLYQDLLSHVFGTNIRKRGVNRVIALFLLIAAIATPVNFTNAILDYGHRRITTVVNWVIGSNMNQLQRDEVKQLLANENRTQVRPSIGRPGKG